jgi:iron complex outermembrane receptor protein
MLIDTRRPLGSIASLAFGALLCGNAPGATAAEVTAANQEPGEVVVTATRRPQPSRDLPVAIDRVDAARIQRGQLQVNLSESLAGVPGASVQNRQNYAQDLQVSVRGFGARSSFGVRGVRLYADGIPGTMPDGQGQFSQFDLGSADHIEVLRGPFSALYGNSSGGVIALFSEDPPPGLQLKGQVAAGSFGMQREALKLSGGRAGSSYFIDAAHFATQGYRDHSAAQRNNLNSRWRVDLSAVATLTLIANAVQTPFVQDPLGLTQAQLANPTQAGSNASTFNTRKSLQQEQFGLAYERHPPGGVEFAAQFYGGHRATTQFQSIPVASQNPATHPGGVIDLARDYWGADLRISAERELAGTPLQLTAGVAYDNLDEDRRGYLNFAGTTLGVMGALRRSLGNRVYDFDQYAQAQWDPAPKWRVLAGLRHSSVDVRSLDRLAAPGAAAVSGVRYQATNPVAGLTYRATPALSIYGTFGRGFETPTLNDIAYRSVDGSVPGLNLGLRPARSSNYELGLKAAGGAVSFNLSAFHIDTHEELAVLQNSRGRSVFQNIKATTRSGLELGVLEPLGSSVNTRIAYTWMRAVVAEPYLTCATVPCLQPDTTVARGSRLPAVPQHSFYSALSWQPAATGLTLTAELVGRAQIYANDTNSAAASGYWLGNLSLGFEQQRSGWHFSEYARVDNVADRRYVGSVIVNESNSRYFEPEPGRAFYLTFSVAHR